MAQRAGRVRFRDPPSSALILVNSHLTYGNGILLEPAVRLLRQRLPYCRTVLVGSPSLVSVFRPTGLVDQCIAWGELPGNWHTDTASPARLAGFGLVFRAFSPAVPAGVELAAARRARCWLSDDFFPGTFYTNRHETDLTLVPLARRLGVVLAAEDRFPDLHLTAGEKAVGKDIWRRILGDGRGLVVGMHIGCSAGAGSRRWPVGFFAEVAEALLNEGKRVVVLGGPDDVADNEELLRRVPRIIDGSNCGSIRETAAFLSSMDCLVTNDSGLMHAANAVGTPVVAVFGPTSEVKSYPLAPAGRATVLKDDLCSCRPCYNVRPRAPDECPDRRCLLSIKPPRVLGAVGKALDWRVEREGR